MIARPGRLLSSARSLAAAGGTQRAAAARRAYERTGDVAYLRAALNHAVKVIRLVPRDDADRAGYLSNLGALLAMAFECSGEEDALRNAVALGREAIATAPAGDCGLAMYHSNLGGWLTRLAAVDGDPELAAEAAALARSAVRLAAADDPERPMYLSNLSCTLVALARLDDDPAVLDEAVRSARAAVDPLPGQDPAAYKYLTNLAIALRSAGERDDRGPFLAEAVQAGEQALSLAPAGHPDRMGVLSGLASAQLRWYEATGDVALIRDAVEHGRAAVAECPDGYFARPVLLSNLAIALGRYSERTGDGEVLAEAVAAGRAAVAACPDGHADLPMFLTNLSLHLSRLFERTDQRTALSEAVQTARRAAGLLPPQHAHRPRYLANLGTTLRAWHDLTGERQALDEALEADRAAAAATAGRPGSATAVILSNLALTLGLAAAADGGPAALTEAVRVARTAVGELPDGHPDLARCETVLGRSLVARYEQAGSAEDLRAAHDVLARALDSPSAPLRMRVDAGQDLARADTLAGDHDGALGAMEAVVGLLPRLAARALRRPDRVHRLGEQAGIAAQAAAAALSCGRPDRAVELLEQARGLLLGESMGMRSELGRLRAQAPDLADEYTRLRDRMAALEAAGAGLAGGSPSGANRISDDRREAAMAWDDLIERIRGRAGLEDFLRPVPLGQLQHCVTGGAAVFVIADQARGDALILTPDPARPVRHARLPGLTAARAMDQAGRLQDALDTVTEGDAAAGRAAQAEILGILQWLWDAVAEPVLTELGHTGPPEPGQWPRLWWCPVGMTAFLPLHAAGYHHQASADQGSRTVLDRVISSYTVTIRALAYARRPAAPGSGQGPGLIVALPLTDGQADLPGAGAELRDLARYLPDARVLAGRQATSAAVLDALPGHCVAHFACHGFSDWNDPEASRLLLADHPLTVTAISGLSLARADLAYLSACSTSRTHPRLADEGFHITAAFQLAGYRNVIGTLWPIADTVAVRAAGAIYSQLTSDGSAPPDLAATPAALHAAVHRLRARYPRAPSVWAAHVHTGGDPLPGTPR